MLLNTPKARDAELFPKNLTITVLFGFLFLDYPQRRSNSSGQQYVFWEIVLQFLNPPIAGRWNSAVSFLLKFLSSHSPPCDTPPCIHTGVR